MDQTDLDLYTALRLELGENFFGPSIYNACRHLVHPEDVCGVTVEEALHDVSARVAAKRKTRDAVAAKLEERLAGEAAAVAKAAAREVSRKAACAMERANAPMSMYPPPAKTSSQWEEMRRRHNAERDGLLLFAPPDVPVGMRARICSLSVGEPEPKVTA